jgi:hypothetical protein
MGFALAFFGCASKKGASGGSDEAGATGGMGCPDAGDEAIAAWKAGGFATEGGSGQTRTAPFEDLNGDGQPEFFVEVVDASNADEFGNLYLVLFATGDRCPKVAGTFLAQKMLRSNDGSIVEVQSRMSEDGCVGRAGMVNTYPFDGQKGERSDSKKCPCPDGADTYEQPPECQHLTY